MKVTESHCCFGLNFNVCSKTVKTFVRISSFVLYFWVNYPFKLDNKCGETSRSLQARLEQILSISVCLMHQMVSEQAVDGLWVSRLSLRLYCTGVSGLNPASGLCDCPAVLELTDQSLKIIREVESWQWDCWVCQSPITHSYSNLETQSASAPRWFIITPSQRLVA